MFAKLPPPRPINPPRDGWVLIVGRSPDRLPPAVGPAISAAGYKIIATASLYGAAALWVRQRAMLHALVVDLDGLSAAELTMLPSFHHLPVVLLPNQADSPRTRTAIAAGAKTWESFVPKSPPPTAGGPPTQPPPPTNQVTSSPFTLYDELSQQPLLSPQEIQALLEPPAGPG